MSRTKIGGTCAILALMAACQFTLPALAQYNGLYTNNPYYGNPYNPYYGNAYNPAYQNWLNRQAFGPKKKLEDAAVGAGLGAAAGAAAGAFSGNGALKGSLVGAGTGVGIGLVKSSATMYNHPIIKKAVYGTAIGTGLGFATTGGNGGEGSTTVASSGENGYQDKKKIEKEALIGGALGLGLGVLTNKNTPPPPPGYPYRY